MAVIIEKSPRKGLMAVEWVMMAYLLATSVFIMVTYTSLPNPGMMVWTRVQVLLVTVALWGVYRMMPCRLTTLFRIIGQFSLLSLWYPDTYELNRVFPNLDHLFAGCEQTIFGCQPSLTFSEVFHWPVFSELMTMGYVSYFPLFAGVAMFYFIWRYDKFERATFVILTSFFIFYVIFIFRTTSDCWPSKSTTPSSHLSSPATGTVSSTICSNSPTPLANGPQPPSPAVM